jgi:nitrite reductase/ring-hydroxylating ferredoxin subunit
MAARADEVSDGEIIGVVVEGVELALYRLQGTLYATGNICSHQFARLSDGFIDGDCVECPLHQAKFHIPTGEARTPPAETAVPIFAVKVEDGAILVDLP